MTAPAGWWRAARSSVSFFTVLPVRGDFDRGTTGRAMLLAPAVGAVLGALAASVGLLGGILGWSPLLSAVAAVAFLAAATRGLHLDGLADLTDGLGAARDREKALEVMRRGDVGAFGVVVLLVVLLAQVAAIEQLIVSGHLLPALFVAGLASRLPVPVSCRRGVPSARGSGLGSTVAGGVSSPAAALVALAATSMAVAVGVVSGLSVVTSTAAVVLAVLGGWGVERIALRRLGGITGDVFGAMIETGITLALLTLAAGVATG